MFKTQIDQWHREFIIFSKDDKKMIREVVLMAFLSMKISKTTEATLTRINWNSGHLYTPYQKSNYLSISINIAFLTEYKIDFDEYANSRFGPSKSYKSERINLKIPFSEFRDWKLQKLMEE